MRSLLLAGTAIALLASPAYAFNFGTIQQFSSGNTGCHGSVGPCYLPLWIWWFLGLLFASTTE